VISNVCSLGGGCACKELMTVGANQQGFIRRRRSNNLSMMTYESFPYSGDQGADYYDGYGFGLTSPLPREFQVIHDSTVPILQVDFESQSFSKRQEVFVHDSGY